MSTEAKVGNITDTQRIDYLAALLQHCPDVEIICNSGTDIEEQVDWMIRVHGCETSEVTAPDFRECIDKEIIAAGNGDWPEPTKSQPLIERLAEAERELCEVRKIAETRMESLKTVSEERDRLASLLCEGYVAGPCIGLEEDEIPVCANCGKSHNSHTDMVTLRRQLMAVDLALYGTVIQGYDPDRALTIQKIKELNSPKLSHTPTPEP